MSMNDPTATAVPVPVPAPQTTPQPSAGEQKPDAETAPNAETTVDSEQTPAADAGAEPTAEQRRERRRNPAQERINELTADKRRLEREKDQLLERVLNGQQPAKPAQTQSDELVEPREADFADYGEFLKKREAYLVEMATRAADKRNEERQKAEQRKSSEEKMRTEAREAAARFNENAKELSPQYEDLDDVIAAMWAGKIPVIANNDHVAKFIMERAEPKTAPALVYFLDNNPKEAQRIEALTDPLAVARELTKLEDKLPKPKARTVTGAPPPPKEVGGKGGSDKKAPDDMSIDEMRKATGQKRRVDYT